MRHATSLQTPFPHMRMRAPPPPYAHTMPTPHAFHLRPYGFYNDAAPNRDAACRIVTKNARLPAWHGIRMETMAMGGIWAQCGSQCRL